MLRTFAYPFSHGWGLGPKTLPSLKAATSTERSRQLRRRVRGTVIAPGPGRAADPRLPPRPPATPAARTREARPPPRGRGRRPAPGRPRRHSSTCRAVAALGGAAAPTALLRLRRHLGAAGGAARICCRNRARASSAAGGKHFSPTRGDPQQPLRLGLSRDDSLSCAASPERQPRRHPKDVPLGRGARHRLRQGDQLPRRRRSHRVARTPRSRRPATASPRVGVRGGCPVRITQRMPPSSEDIGGLADLARLTTGLLERP